MRKEYAEIQAIAKKMGCSDIYSWSKLNTYINDPYNFYLKYILRVPEDKNDSIYAPLGTACHDALEDFYSKKIKHEDMLEQFEDKLFEYTVGGLKYDRSDEEKNKKIGDKYEACIRHFFLNHQKIKGKPKLEMFIPVKINDILIQGYIDFIHKEKRIINDEEKDVMVITDFKTSTIYKGEKFEGEKGQLILYGLGVHQKLKIPLNQIIVRWAFLKYVEVECIQANGKVKLRTIERNSIGNSLASSAKMWLKKSESKPTEEEIDGYILQIISDNSIDCLPNDVKDKFIIRDCYVEVPLTEESVNELKQNVINTVAEIKDKEKEYNKTKSDKVWWQEVTDKNSYFQAVLSGYSAKIHKPYAEYLEQRDMFKNKVDDSNVGEDDMEWLEGLLD